MDNARQIRRIHNIFGSLKSMYGKEDDIRNTLNAMKQDHEEELQPRPEPPPLKLEAGCEVQLPCGDCGTVIGIDNWTVWVLADTGSHGLYGVSRLTVTEAATPGKGDTVLTDFGVAIICAWGHGSFKVTNGTVHADLNREEFTILHKAPKNT